jgi:hypothetical protein
MASSCQLLLGSVLLVSAVFACGGNARQSGTPAGADAGAGASSSAGASASSSAGAGAMGGTPAGGMTGSGGAGVSGTAGDLTIGPSCDTTGPAACRARIGDPFISVSLNGSEHRYTFGCGPQCGPEQIPSTSTGLEGDNKFYVAGCDATQASATIIIAPSDQAPSQLVLCSSPDTGTCVHYVLSGWAGTSGDNLHFQGSAQATPKDSTSTPSSLALSYDVCQ